MHTKELHFFDVRCAPLCRAADAAKAAGRCSWAEWLDHFSPRDREREGARLADMTPACVPTETKRRARAARASSPFDASASWPWAVARTLPSPRRCAPPSRSFR